jgi:type III secretory pathway component EscT
MADGNFNIVGLTFYMGLLGLLPLLVVSLTSSVDATVTGMVMSLTIMALYFASGCFELTLRAVYDGYRTWPADRFTPMFNVEMGDVLLGLLDRIVSAGFQLAAPLVALMLLADLSIQKRQSGAVFVSDCAVCSRS